MTDRLRLDQHTDDTLTELYDQLDHAKADIALCRAQKWPERLARAEAERDQHAAQLAAVRELHQPVPDGIGWKPSGGYGDISPACGTCGTHEEYATPWPCATIRALDTALAGPTQPPAAAQADTEGSPPCTR